uniref:Uncharacterized protein n=1 Tax=Entomoneis paludosa TaxID=265537 RepID=A0A7S3DPR2_9STRA
MEPSDTAQDSWQTPERLAVVCVDPSSVLQGGSILGDKTRMPTLAAAHDRVLVRPAPSSAGTLGGLAGQRTYDTMQLLGHAAGGTKRPLFDVIFLETVGLGQSEVEIAQCVNVVLLCIPPGGGDALQGVKKGILEVTHVVAITKADGSLQAAAQSTAADYQGALQFRDGVEQSLQPPDSSSHENCAGGAPRRVILTSAETGQGLADLWQTLCHVRRQQLESGQWRQQERTQQEYWMWKSFHTLVQKHVMEQYQSTSTQEPQDEESPHKNTLVAPPPRVAAAQLLRQLLQSGIRSRDDNGNENPSQPP